MAGAEAPLFDEVLGAALEGHEISLGSLGRVATTAGTEGPDWSARAEGWAEVWAGMGDPARLAIADAAGIGPGMRVLDIACGSGEFCALAAGRGAEVAGIDAAEGMIAIARRRLPDADLRVGPMEQLPWEDDAFDLATAVNALQFAADFVDALREAARVVRPGGAVAVCNWGRVEHRDLLAVMRTLREGPGAAGPTIGDPGELERRARLAGLEPLEAGEVDVPFAVPDQATLEHAFLVDSAGGALERLGEAEVRRRVAEAAAPYRRDDGSYRFENRFRYLIARV
jgi:SAM-dependent methyltransferase